MRDDAVWWRIAWRNLGRHRGRTIITATGLAFGYLSAVVIVGLTDGMSAELAENGTRLLTGQVQVHAAEYLPERSMHETIGGAGGVDVSALLARIESHPDVLAVTPRVHGGGLLSSGDLTNAGLFLGVDPEREAQVSTLLSQVRSGRLPRAGAREILMGAEMARQLSVDVGDEIVVVAPAIDGSMGNDLYTMTGTFETGSTALDTNYAILPLEDLQLLMAMEPERIHEVVLTVTRPWDTPAVAASLADSLETAGLPLDVSPWTELRPELAEGLALMDSVNFVIVLVIFAMAIFGVANTMLIGAFERRREFAVVRALGTAPAGVWRTVVYEGVILGVISLVAGAVITWPLMVWWHNSPPDLREVFGIGGFSWSGTTWRPILRVEYSLDAPVVSAVALFLTAVLAALYPAWKATRVPPADALADR